MKTTSRLLLTAMSLFTRGLRRCPWAWATCPSHCGSTWCLDHPRGLSQTWKFLPQWNEETVVCNSCKKGSWEVSFSLFFNLTFLVVFWRCTWVDWLGLQLKRNLFLNHKQRWVAKTRSSALNCYTVNTTHFFFCDNQLCASWFTRELSGTSFLWFAAFVFGSFMYILLLPVTKQNKHRDVLQLMAAVTVRSSGAICCRLLSYGCTLQVTVIICHLLSGRHHLFDKGFWIFVAFFFLLILWPLHVLTNWRL